MTILGNIAIMYFEAHRHWKKNNTYGPHEECLKIYPTITESKPQDIPYEASI
jgi:hypothetical protein